MPKNKIPFFASRWGIILAGSCIGLCAALLQKLDNPTNMGVCTACFVRDVAGALGLHRLGVTQYIRPEVIGFVLGALLAALCFREFKARTGSAPLVRFVLGCFAMIGALVFLGCPWRAVLRLAGGDLNAIAGLIGLIHGIGMGLIFLKRGFNLGRSRKTYRSVGWVMPAAMAGLLLLLIFKPKFTAAGPIFFSEKGPGAAHALLWFSLGGGLIIGFIAQRTRFCTMGAFRDVLLMRDFHLLTGVGAMLLAAFLMNLAMGQVSFGLEAQPISHSDGFWNFTGMLLTGVSVTLAGGCPGRQLILSGEGDADAGVFVMGMLTGAAFAHNFALAGVPDKIVDGVVTTGGIFNVYGEVAVLIGIGVCLIIGFTMRETWQKKGA